MLIIRDAQLRQLREHLRGARWKQVARELRQTHERQLADLDEPRLLACVLRIVEHLAGKGIFIPEQQERGLRLLIAHRSGQDDPLSLPWVDGVLETGGITGEEKLARLEAGFAARSAP